MRGLDSDAGADADRIRVPEEENEETNGHSACTETIIESLHTV